MYGRKDQRNKWLKINVIPARSGNGMQELLICTGSARTIARMSVNMNMKKKWRVVKMDDLISRQAAIDARCNK